MRYQQIIPKFEYFKESDYKRVFAVGDIHGCCETLYALLSDLKKDLTKEDLVVFIGDYIDRGPNSFACVEQLLSFKSQYKCLFLKGNHEDMFLSFMNKPGMYGDSFLQNGGRHTLNSYNITGWQDWDKIPKSHRDFYESLLDGCVGEKFIFTHAQLETSYEKPEDNSYEILHWCRITGKYKHDYGKLNIHGHTIVDEVFDNYPYSINIDTGCFRGGMEANLTGGKLTYIELAGEYPYKIKQFSYQEK